MWGTSPGTEFQHFLFSSDWSLAAALSLQGAVQSQSQSACLKSLSLSLIIHSFIWPSRRTVVTLQAKSCVKYVVIFREEQATDQWRQIKQSPQSYVHAANVSTHRLLLKAEPSEEVKNFHCSQQTTFLSTILCTASPGNSSRDDSKCLQHDSFRNERMNPPSHSHIIHISIISKMKQNCKKWNAEEWVWCLDNSLISHNNHDWLNK